MTSHYEHLSLFEQEQLLVEMTDRMYNAMDFLAAIQAGRCALMNSIKEETNNERTTTD